MLHLLPPISILEIRPLRNPATTQHRWGCKIHRLQWVKREEKQWSE